MFSCVLGSVWLVPLLFLVLNYNVVLGRSVFSHDTADGLAAFKFVLLGKSFFPPYWNWLDVTGLPFWLDMGWFRAQDPLMWLPMTLLRRLPLRVEHAFNLFLLVRMVMVGFGLALLFREFRFSPFLRNACVGMVLFGGLGHVFFRSVGMLDTIFGMVFLLFWGIRFLRTEKAGYAVLWGFFFVHSTLSYHIIFTMLVLGFTLLLWCLFNPAFLKSLGAIVLRNSPVLAVVLVMVVSSLASVLAATKQQGIVPLLRSTVMGSTVSSDGFALSPKLIKGNNILSRDRLSQKISDCGVSMNCAVLTQADLETLVKYEPREANAYITYGGLFAAVASLFFLRTPLFWVTCGATLFSLLCGLGMQTPFYPALQIVIPVTQWVRHTEFFLPIFVLGLVLMAGQFGMWLQARLEKLSWLPMLFLALVLTEGFVYHHKVGKTYLRDFNTKSPVSQELIFTFSTRAYRVHRQWMPRWFEGVLTGRATALEGSTKFRTASDDILRFQNIPSFVGTDYLKARLDYSSDLDALKVVFGIIPQPVFRWYPQSSISLPGGERVADVQLVRTGRLILDNPPSSTSGAVSPMDALPPLTPVRIEGDNLVVRPNVPAKGWGYLAIAHSLVQDVFVDQQRVDFYRAQKFGIAFPLERGNSRVEIRPDLSTAHSVKVLYYGSYLLGGIALLLVFCMRHVSRWIVPARSKRVADGLQQTSFSS